jgi:hypothetical protein
LKARVEWRKKWREDDFGQEHRMESRLARADLEVAMKKLVCAAKERLCQLRLLD